LSFADDSRFLFDASFLCATFTADLQRAAADLVRIEVVVVARRRRVEAASSFFIFLATFFAATATAASFFLSWLSL